MEDVTVKIYTEAWKLDESAQKRMLTKSKVQYSASIEGRQPAEVKGCPMGRSFKDAGGAVDDLIGRVMMESKVRLVVEEVKCRDYR